MNENFETDPRSYALELVDDGWVDARTMILAALQWMSTADVRRMLDANEMSPRFAEAEDACQFIQPAL